MSDTLTKKISGEASDYTLLLKPEGFDRPETAPLSIPARYDRKYNLKIRQDDLALLDAMAAHEDIPRSVLLNNLLHDILLDELMGIAEHDVRLLLAQTADSRAHYDDLSSPWVFDAIGTECSRIVENIHLYNRAELDVQDDPYAPPDHSWNSDTYSAVKTILEGMDK
jgi:hypothetical protein